MHAQHCYNVPIACLSTVPHRHALDFVAEIQLKVVASFHGHNRGGRFTFALSKFSSASSSSSYEFIRQKHLAAFGPEKSCGSNGASSKRTIPSTLCFSPSVDNRPLLGDRPVEKAPVTIATRPAVSLSLAGGYAYASHAAPMCCATPLATAGSSWVFFCMTPVPAIFIFSRPLPTIHEATDPDYSDRAVADIGFSMHMRIDTMSAIGKEACFCVGAVRPGTGFWCSFLMADLFVDGPRAAFWSVAFVLGGYQRNEEIVCTVS